MDARLIGGLVVVCAIVAVAGALFYNYDFNTPGVSDNNSNTGNSNNTANNTTTNQLTQILLLDNQTGPNSSPYPGPGPSPGPTPRPSPGPTPGPTPSPTPDPMDHIISLFDAYLNKYYNQSLIPGMAVVIVKDGKIIYLKTLGVKDLASGAPVDENTLFGIGSNTKAFSATLVARLVSEGLMSWDDPISKYFKVPEEFLLWYGENITGQVTIRDALSHRSGLPTYGGDDYYTYFNDSYLTSLYKLRYMENTTPFRSTFQYNNIIYALGGYSAARVNNTTWGELVKQDLLIPLGMTTAVSSYWDFLKTSNHVTPYKLLQNGTMVNYDIIPDPIGPAGSIYASINEVANWLKFQVADTGYYNGKKILSKKELDETRTGQIKMTDVAQYGLGWIVTEYSIEHAGSSDSFHSQTTIFPSKGLGIIILSNGGEYASYWRQALDLKFKELLKGDDNYDPWPMVIKHVEETWKPVPPTPPLLNQALPLSGYVGVYRNDLYGDVNITSSNDTLICYYGTNNRLYELKHWNNNTFEDQKSNYYFNFTDIHNGTSHQVTVKLQLENATFNRTK